MPDDFRPFRPFRWDARPVGVAAAFTVTVTGTAVVGETLTLAAPAVYDSVQWTRDGVAVVGATGATYALTEADDGAAIRAEVTVGGVTVISGAINVTVPAPVALTAPSFSDATPNPGGTVIITFGTYTNDPSITGVLTLGGVDVTASLMGNEYDIPPGAADGATLVWTETATTTGGSAAPQTATATVTAQPMPVATTQPSVSGAFQVGAMLTLDPGVWTDAQTLTRNWTRDGVDIPGATGLTYWLAAADDGALISAYVDGTNATGTTRALATGGQVVVAGAFDALISGTPLVGETLTLIEPAVYDSVQWTRDGTIITGATAATYTTVGGDNGKTVAAVVTVGGDMLSSNGIYIAVPAPVSVVAPVITGSFIVGEELALTEGMWANGPTLQAQWTRDGLDIAGETGLTYTPVAGDVDTLISAYVDGTNTGGTLRAQATGGDLVRWDPFQITEEVDVDGNVTASVSWEGTLDWLRIGGMFNGFAGLYTAYHDGTPLANDHTAGVAGRALTILKTLPSNVSILHPNGVPAVGETLTAGAILILYTDGQAEPAFTVKWQRDGVDIPGATGATYVLTTADVGYDVRPVFTITATGQPSVTEYGSAILLAWDGPVATAAELGGVTLDASGTEPAAIVAPVIGGVGVEKVIFGTA